MLRQHFQYHFAGYEALKQKVEKYIGKCEKAFAYCKGFCYNVQWYRFNCNMIYNKNLMEENQ